MERNDKEIKGLVKARYISLAKTKSQPDLRDKEIQCVGLGTTFTFTAFEQNLFTDRGFTN